MVFELNGAGREVEAVRPVKSRPPVLRKQNSASALRRQRPMLSRHSIAAIGWNNTLGGVCVCVSDWVCGCTAQVDQRSLWGWISLPDAPFCDLFCTLFMIFCVLRFLFGVSGWSYCLCSPLVSWDVVIVQSSVHETCHPISLKMCQFPVFFSVDC